MKCVPMSTDSREKLTEGSFQPGAEGEFTGKGRACSQRKQAGPRSPNCSVQGPKGPPREESSAQILQKNQDQEAPRIPICTVSKVTVTESREQVTAL